MLLTVKTTLRAILDSINQEKDNLDVSETTHDDVETLEFLLAEIRAKLKRDVMLRSYYERKGPGLIMAMYDDRF